MRLRLEWGYISQQVLRTRTIQPSTELQLPTDDYTFTAPEGVLLDFTAVFDSPECGLRVEVDPSYDSEETFTVSNLVNLGLTRVESMIYAVIPPTNPAGRYTVRLVGPWTWKDWMRIYVFNPHTASHSMLFHSYDIAVLKEKRPGDRVTPLTDLKTLQLAYEMYPELRDTMRDQLSKSIETMLQDLGIRRTMLEKKMEAAR